MPVIATNVAANAALMYLNRNSAKETSALSKLASGSNIVQASDDAAGLAIGTQLSADVSVLTQSSVNASQASSILQVADGGLSSISDILTRLDSLATEAASSNVSDTQRADDIQTEWSQLTTEISTVLGATTYGGQALLTGALSSATFQVGTGTGDTISVALSDLSSASAVTALVGSGSGATIGVSSQGAAQSAMTAITAAIDTITTYRAQVGAYESQFNFSSSSISTNETNTAAAESTIMDADEAQQKSNLSSADVLSQAAIAALSQASKMPTELLTLIQS
jgi:flagellin